MKASTGTPREAQGKAPPRDAGRICIVGAGPAGSAVSDVLAAAGVAHDIFDEHPRAGGNFFRRRFDSSPLPLEARTAAPGPGTLLTGIPVLAVTPAHVVQFDRGRGIEERSYDAVFLCTGAYDGQFPRRGRGENWVAAGALQALLKGQGILPEGRVVLCGAGPFLHVVGADLVRAGARVTHVIDRVSFGAYASLLPFSLAHAANAATFAAAQLVLRRRGARVRFGCAVTGIEGDTARLSDGTTVGFEHVGISDFFAPQTQLARTAGCRMVYSPRGGYFVGETDDDGRTSQPGIFVCGEGQGVRGAPHASLSGTIAGCAWLADTGRAVPRGFNTDSLRRKRRRLARFAEKLEEIMYAPPMRFGDEDWACACERVPVGAVREAVATGLDDLSSIKVVTRCGMGNCQGRYCEPVVCRVIGESGRVPRAPLSQKGLVRPVRAGDLAHG